MISGRRVRQARELRRLTQAELAEAVQVAQSMIAQLEREQRQPSRELLEAIAFQTGFPPAFFQKPAVDDFPIGSLLFRARTTLKAGERKSVYRYVQIVSEIVRTMAQHVNELPLRIAPLSGVDPHDAAQIARSQLGLSPDQPVSNLVHALEKAGAYIVILPDAVEQLDGFSTWVGDQAARPIIAINPHMPVDRRRFSLAHELGELVIGRISAPSPSAREQLINQFASEFLLPEESVRDELLSPVTLTTLLPLKRRWGVSLQALVRRARDLDTITERQYLYLNKQISKRGWGRHEPGSDELPDEVPRAVRKIAEVVYGDPVNVRQMARDAAVSTQFVETMLCQYREFSKRPAVREPLNGEHDAREDSIVVSIGSRERREKRE